MQIIFLPHSQKTCFKVASFQQLSADLFYSCVGSEVKLGEDPQPPAATDKRCYIISQDEELHLNLLYVTTVLSFYYRTPDEQLFTTLVFSPTSLHRRQEEAASEQKTLWWRAAELIKQVFYCGSQSVHPVWQLNVKKVQKCSDTSCSPARTSRSLSNVGGSADFVVFLW